MWTAGVNNLGQCGHSIAAEITAFKPVHKWSVAWWEQRAATAWVTFSVALTETGKVGISEFEFSHSGVGITQLGTVEQGST